MMKMGNFGEIHSLLVRNKISKSHQEVLLVKNSSEADPYSLLKSFMIKMGYFGNIQGKEENFLFCKMRHSRVEDVVDIFDTTKMSYGSMLNMFNRRTKEVGVVLRKSGIHCLRIGGATEYTRLGASGNLVQKRGRWVTESSRVGYQRSIMEDILETLQLF